MRTKDISCCHSVIIAGAKESKVSAGRTKLATLFAVFTGALALAPVTCLAGSCASLAQLKLEDTTITLAQEVSAGSFTMPRVFIPSRPQAKAVQFRQAMEQSFKNSPAFCRVAATIKPTKDSDIKIEVWMPESGWNGKFLGVGNGGWAGNINYGGLAHGVARGYATSSTDTGHEGMSNDARFAFGHREKLIDFGYRSVHLMTLRAKSIITAFYGKPSRLAYWNGCSTGGKQGLTEAQRFPSDFNGIVEGDPASFFSHLMFSVMWPNEVTLQVGATVPRGKLILIHKTVLKACDGLDGVVDGIINDPTRCHFDPETLECKGPDEPTCLTPAQVEVVRQIYVGPKDPHNGRQIFPGQEPGSELGWSRLAGGSKPDGIAETYFKYIIFKNPAWDWRTLNYDRDVVLAEESTSSILDATNPDLRAFKAHGGRLIMYHGWSDPGIAPGESVNYYNSVVKAMGGAAETEDFVRLFMIPGMGHCRGGPGPDNWDKLGVLEQWVEQGKAPERIVASHQTHGVVDMTRPLCPFPEVAQWKGSGNTNDAANFVCVEENIGKDSAFDYREGLARAESKSRQIGRAFHNSHLQ